MVWGGTGRWAWFAMAVATACGGPKGGGATDVQETPFAGDPAALEEPPGVCTDIYDEGTLPTFDVTVTPDVWSKLQADFDRHVENIYPATFEYQGEKITTAGIRLRGNQSVCFDKMQFAIDFNEFDPNGRFHGLKRIDLDHGACHMFEERLGMWFARKNGLAAPCVNHARLNVNGRFYGLFVNLEHQDKEFLKRHFDDASGNLYKNGRTLKTNEDSGDTSDLEALNSAADVATLQTLMDLDEAVHEWAAEAVLPARDNYWLNGWNYDLYHHPTRGFLYVPSDWDQAFPNTEDGVSLPSLWPAERQPPADIVLDDPQWKAEYEQQVDAMVVAFDPAVLEYKLDTWWKQTAPSLAEDPHYVYPPERLDELKAFIRGRAAWLKNWRRNNPVK